MTHTAPQITAHWQTNVDALKSLGLQAHAVLERLIELNLTDGKTAWLECCNHAQAALDTKDVMELLTLQTGLLQSLSEKSAAYGQHLYTLVTDTGAAFNKDFETRWIETNAKTGTRLPRN